MRDKPSTENTNEDVLGGRLPLLDPAELTGERREVYDRLVRVQLPWATKAGFRMQTASGKLIGPFNALLRTPDIAQPFLDWGAAHTKSTHLKPDVREVVILTVGAIWDAQYELYAHTAVGLEAGLSEAAIEAIRDHREPEDLSVAAIAAYRFIDCLFRTHRAPAEVYEQAVGALGEEGVIAAVQLAGRYVTVSATLNAFAVPVPDTE